MKAKAAHWFADERIATQVCCYEKLMPVSKNIIHYIYQSTKIERGNKQGES